MLCAALDLIDAGALDAAEVLALEKRCAARVGEAAVRAVTRPRLETRTQVTAALTSPVGPALEAEAAMLARALPAQALTLAQGINGALAEALAHYPEAILFGEDVAKKGGVYGVTKGLFAKFGPLRVFNTLLDEQTILGLALGTAMRACCRCRRIQYLAYLHNAEDQLRGEAARACSSSPIAPTQPDALAHRGARLPEGLRRALSQRQLRGGAAGHPRRGGGGAGARRRRPG
ncbi:MAG: hypothetical protein IPM13_16925 [Phycisphaerales bacterium]|nr:hypothetical protein [Phycisphaerales bacterium]